jgi:hypothetical protein
LTGIRRLVSANAILWQKLYARLSEYTFDRCNRVLVSRAATHLDIRDRVAMEPGGPSQVPNRSIERSSQSELVQLPQARIANVACDKVRTIIAISPNQGGTE